MNVWGSQLVINSASYKNWYEPCNIIWSKFCIKRSHHAASSIWAEGKPFIQVLTFMTFIYFSNCITFLGFPSYLHIPVALFFSSLLILSFPKCYSSQPGASGIHMTSLCFDVLVKLTSALRLKTHNIHFQDRPPRRKRDGGERKIAPFSRCQPSFYTCSCVYTLLHLVFLNHDQSALDWKHCLLINLHDFFFSQYANCKYIHSFYCPCLF